MTATALPRTAAELEEMLHGGRVAGMFNGGQPTPEFGDFIRAYAQALQGDGTDLARQVQAEVQRELANWLRDNQVDSIKRVNLDPAEPVAGRSARAQGLYSKRAPGARVDKLLASALGADDDRVGHFLRNIYHRNQDPKAAAFREQLASIRNDYGSTVPADGGFLIPETLRSELLRVSLESSIVRPRARVIPMESLRVPFPTIDETSHATSVYGGLIGYWTEESGALTESQATFGRVVLEAKKLTGYSEIPNELLADAVGSFASLVEQLWPEAIAFFEDDAFLTGSGVGEPLGVLNAGARITVTENTANAAKWADVVAMYARMLPGSLGRAVWVANIDTFPQLATMELSGGSPAVWINNLADGPPMTILGRPVYFTEKVPALGTTGALNFIDFGYYLIGDRQAMQFSTSEHFKFNVDQTAVRIIERVDGRPWLNSALTPRNGANTLSPYVSLLSA